MCKDYNLVFYVYETIEIECYSQVEESSCRVGNAQEEMWGKVSWSDVRQESRLVSGGRTKTYMAEF